MIHFPISVNYNWSFQASTMTQMHKRDIKVAYIFCALYSKSIFIDFVVKYHQKQMIHFNCMFTFSFRALTMAVQKENIGFSLWQDILVHVLCNYCLRDDGFPVHGHVLLLILGCFSRCLWMCPKSILYPYIMWAKFWCKKNQV